MGFEEEFKWCPECNRYVNYLQNADSSYCVQCGGEVILFSEEDWEKFQTAMTCSKKSGKGVIRKRSRPSSTK